MGQKIKSQSQSKITNQIKSPLTLALSRRERELIEVFGSAMPTWDTESNSGFEKPTNRLPLPRERAGVRGSSNTEHKPTACFSTTQQDERKLGCSF